VGRSFAISKEGFMGKRSWKGCGGREVLLVFVLLSGCDLIARRGEVRTPNPVTRIVTVSWSGAPVLPMVLGMLALWRMVFFSGCRICDGNQTPAGKDGDEAMIWILNEYGSMAVDGQIPIACELVVEEDCVIGEAFRRGLDYIK
jgi:hypothetical protein